MSLCLSDAPGAGGRLRAAGPDAVEQDVEAGPKGLAGVRVGSVVAGAVLAGPGGPLPAGPGGGLPLLGLALTVHPDDRVYPDDALVTWNPMSRPMWERGELLFYVSTEWTNSPE